MDLAKYNNFRTEEFAADENFWVWVLEDNAEQNFLWNTFLHCHPHKQQDVEQVRLLVLSLNYPMQDLPEEKVTQIWNQIANSVSRYSVLEKQQEHQFPNSKSAFRKHL